MNMKPIWRAVARQANDEYEMVCKPLPPPEGWQMDPEMQDAEAPPEELLCIRDIQLNGLEHQTFQ